MFDHDPTGEAFARYASGAMDPAVRLMLETQGALRAGMGAQTHTVDAVGGAMLESEDPVDMNEGALTAALAGIDAVELDAQEHRVAMQSANAALQELLDLPEPLREHALLAVGATGWKFAGPGIRALNLDVGGTAHAQLLRIEPGFGAPKHDHTGFEHTLVVTGAFADETGRYGVGDIATRRPGEVHRPVAEAGAVCFALAVSDGDIALTGALGLLQRMLTRH